MSTTRRSHWLRTMLVTLSAGLLVASMGYFVPDADAGRGGRRGGGSVKHSSRSKPSARPNHGGSRSIRSGASTGNRRANNVNVNRGGNTRVNVNRGGGGRGRAAPARRGGTRAGYRAGRRDARYSARKDARRDWMRFRTVNHLIRAGVYLATRPRYSTTVVVTGRTYYYAGGVYYVQEGTRYVVVSPPPGAVVYAVPTATTVVYAGEQPYYYYGGTYYAATDKPAETPDATEEDLDASTEEETELQTLTSTVSTEDGEEMELPPVPVDDEQNYEVVAPPVGATVPYLPDDASESTVNGKKYFVHEGTYYQPFASDGDTIYLIVEDPKEA